MTMEMILILIAGGIIGVWHERDKAKAARAAYRAGEAKARNTFKTHFIYGQRPKMAVPVPGYSQAAPSYVPAYLRKAQKEAAVNEIAAQAVAVGRAAGRVQ